MAGVLVVVMVVVGAWQVWWWVDAWDPGSRCGWVAGVVVAGWLGFWWSWWSWWVDGRCGSGWIAVAGVVVAGCIGS